MTPTQEKWEISKGNQTVVLVTASKSDKSGAMVFADDLEQAKKYAARIVQCVNGWDELQKQRDDLLEACEMIECRLLNHGEWDEGCFYYAGNSASELEEPLGLLKVAITAAEQNK